MDTQTPLDEDGFVPLRKACPAEQRLIARHGHGYYGNIAVAGIYTFPSHSTVSGLDRVEFYARALRACVDSCPCLSSVYSRNAKGEMFFYRVKKIDLRRHFNLLSLSTVQPSATTDQTVAELFQQLHNDPQLSFAARKAIPNWRLDVYPFPDSEDIRRVFISFTYNHALADGLSGKILHQIFLNALSSQLRTEQVPTETIFETCPTELPGLPHLPISISYLLKPALGQYLPTFLSKMLGFRASVSGSDSDTWTGSNTFASSFDEITSAAIRIITVDNKTLSAVLKACRDHQTGLTALLNEIIARSVVRRLPAGLPKVTEQTNFVSAVPTDIRATVGMSSDTTGVFSSAAYPRLERSRCYRPSGEILIDQTLWKSARDNTALISKSRISAKNQPTGLLAWIYDFDAWCRQQIGRSRDGSWEISNLLSFRPNLSATIHPVTDAVKVEKMFFCQPADATGLPLYFNVISVHDGDMTICVSWQPGSMDFVAEDSEYKFVRAVLKDLLSYLDLIAVSY